MGKEAPSTHPLWHWLHWELLEWIREASKAGPGDGRPTLTLSSVWEISISHQLAPLEPSSPATSSVSTEHPCILNSANHITPLSVHSLLYPSGPKPGFIAESPAEFIINSVPWAPSTTDPLNQRFLLQSVTTTAFAVWKCWLDSELLWGFCFVFFIFMIQSDIFHFHWYCLSNILIKSWNIGGNSLLAAWVLSLVREL